MKEKEQKDGIVCEIYYGESTDGGHYTKRIYYEEPDEGEEWDGFIPTLVEYDKYGNEISEDWDQRRWVVY